MPWQVNSIRLTVQLVVGSSCLDALTGGYSVGVVLQALYQQASMQNANMPASESTPGQGPMSGQAQSPSLAFVPPTHASAQEVKHVPLDACTIHGKVHPCNIRYTSSNCRVQIALLITPRMSQTHMAHI